MNHPYCFVITSFGKKDNLSDLKQKYSAGKAEPLQQIDFDKIYDELVKPAVLKAGLEPLIEREETNFGSIHKTMYEKIILCEFCVADLTNANPNAYYELGMRFAVKPFSTIPIIASSHFPLPFDVGFNRIFVYQVDSDFNLSDRDNDVDKLSAILLQAKNSRLTDSPLYDLINGISFQNSVAHEKTDVFREKVIYNESIKKDLALARSISADTPEKAKELKIKAIAGIMEKFKPLENIETAVLMDFMISFRNIEAFDEMKQLIEELPRYVFNTVMVQEQYAFVLNRIGSKSVPVNEFLISEAEKALLQLEESGKASSETYGIWGRIYKDKFERAYKAGNHHEAKVHLKKALHYYQNGFISDPRDAYPGVNYITCLELSGEKQRALRLVPAVEYAVRAKMSKKLPDYWDYATLLELAIIEGNYDQAMEFLFEARPLANESWMTGSTRSNLDKIQYYRALRGEDTKELQQFITMVG